MVSDVIVLCIAIVSSATVIYSVKQYVALKIEQRYKGKYMRMARELKQYQKQSQVNPTDLIDALSDLGEDELDTIVEELGLPKPLINFALKNPDKVAPLLEKFLGKPTKTPKSTKDLSINEDEFL